MIPPHAVACPNMSRGLSGTTTVLVAELDRHVLRHPAAKHRVRAFQARIDDGDANARAGGAAPGPLTGQAAEAEPAAKSSPRVQKWLGPGRERLGHLPDRRSRPGPLA